MNLLWWTGTFRCAGLRLMKPAAQSGLGDLVRLTGTDFALVECFEPSQDHGGMSGRWRPFPGIPGWVGCSQPFEAGGVSGGCGNEAASKHAPDAFIWKKSSP